VAEAVAEVIKLEAKPNKATLVVRLDMDTMAVMVPMQIKAAAVVLEPLVVTMAVLVDNILL